MHWNKIVFCFLLLLTTTSLFSQTKAELKEEKEIIKKEIKYTTELLEKNKKNREKSLYYLKVLEKQIRNQEMLLETLKFETKLLDIKIRETEEDILNTENEIASEERNLVQLKLEYEKMIYAAFKKKDTRNDLIFIISAKDFNQAYQRLVYLKQYSSFRKNQANRIISTQKKLQLYNRDLLLKKEQLILSFESKKITEHFLFICKKFSGEVRKLPTFKF